MGISFFGRRDKMEKVKFLLLGFIFILVQCGGQAGTRVGNPPSVTDTQNFPTNFAVVSPLEVSSTTTSSLVEDDGFFLAHPDLLAEQLVEDVLNYATTQELFSESAYNELVTEISTILTGTSATACQFDIADIVTQATDAACYGPAITYENHPDASGGAPNASGQLPTGDVGIWTADQSGTGEACSSAQLNAKLRGFKNQTQSALKALAGMICVSNVNSLTFPSSAGDSLTLTTQLDSALTTTGYSVTSATVSTIEASSSNLQTNLGLTLTYSGSDVITAYTLVITNDTDSTDVININLAHLALDTSNSTYVGNLNYRFNFDDSMQANCPTGELTQAGVISYYRDSSSSLNLHADSAGYCTKNVNAFTNNLLDPDDSHATGTNDDGWGMNWTTFLANFNPSTLVGNYASLWQAGPGDSHARILNVSVFAGQDSQIDANAYFGFGDQVQTSLSGAIAGMICNWAGPSNNHNPVDLVQRQIMMKSSTAKRFVADSSNITYAPTNSCDYDGTGTFGYDVDGDGTLEASERNLGVVSNDLVGKTSVYDADTNLTLPSQRTGVTYSSPLSN